MRRVVFVSPVAFAGLRQRHQGLATELVRAGYRVEYIDPLSGGGFSARRLPPGGGERDGREKRLRVWSVAVPFRAARWPALQKTVIALAWKLLLRAGLPCDSNPLLWVADPSWSSLAPCFKGFRMYDRCDRHGLFPGQDPAPWRHHEQTLYAACDLILATTPTLADEAGQAGAPEVRIVPNAIDATWLEDRKSLPVRIYPRRFHGSGEPLRLLSAGAHYEWVDCDWLSALADHPGFELHLAGPGRGLPWERLCRHPRVKSHGRLGHDELCHLMATMDVGLVAFIPSPLTETVDPVKVYEYAALGLQVWSTPVESLRSHPFVDRIIADPRQFDGLPPLDELRQDQTGADVRMQREVPTWRDRLRSILDRLPSPEA